jgi:hypothetical protein
LSLACYALTLIAWTHSDREEYTISPLHTALDTGPVDICTGDPNCVGQHMQIDIRNELLLEYHFELNLQKRVVVKSRLLQVNRLFSLQVTRGNFFQLQTKKTRKTKQLHIRGFRVVVSNHVYLQDMLARINH